MLQCFHTAEWYVALACHVCFFMKCSAAGTVDAFGFHAFMLSQHARLAWQWMSFHVFQCTFEAGWENINKVVDSFWDTRNHMTSVTDRVCGQKSLQWRHISVISSPITSTSTGCSSALSGSQHRNITTPHYWSFARQIQRWLMDSLAKGQYCRKTFHVLKAWCDAGTCRSHSLTQCWPIVNIMNESSDHTTVICVYRTPKKYSRG